MSCMSSACTYNACRQSVPTMPVVSVYLKLKHVELLNDKLPRDGAALSSRAEPRERRRAPPAHVIRQHRARVKLERFSVCISCEKRKETKISTMKTLKMNYMYTYVLYTGD